MSTEYENNFERRGRDYLWWFGAANDLYISAGILWFSAREGEYWRHKQWNPDVVRFASSAPFLMLYGMALEALMKAIYAKQTGKPPPDTIITSSTWCAMHNLQ